MKLINPLSLDWYDHCQAYGDEHGRHAGFSVWATSIVLPTIALGTVLGLAVSLLAYVLVQFPFLALGVIGAPVFAGSVWLGRHMVRAIRSWGAR